jgi:hypothetical protein
VRPACGEYGIVLVCFGGDGLVGRVGEWVGGCGGLDGEVLVGGRLQQGTWFVYID